MTQEPTLLAHLVPRMTSQVEDAATDALAFILNKSKACRGVLDDLLRDGDFEPEPIKRVETQVTYEDGSRPDMVGYDPSGSKRLLVESKFWASLLEGQASGYYGQLEEDGPGVLLFIAPDSRIETLWAEIKRQMEGGEEGVQLEILTTAKRVRRAKVKGTDKQLMLISWSHLLDRMATAVAGDSTVASDIQQLRGLAQYQDESTFLPIHPQEFGLALPRRIRGLHQLIDDIVDARGQDWTTKGFKATPHRDGHGRYFGITDVPGWLYLGIRYSLWVTSAHTPLWVIISKEVPLDPAKTHDVTPSLIESGIFSRHFMVPIHLRTGVEYEQVLDDAARQVKQITDMVKKP